jgi:hypothetical protein
MANVEELLETLQGDIQRLQMLTGDGVVRRAADLMMASLDLAFSAKGKHSMGIGQCFGRVSSELGWLKKLLKQTGRI